MHVDNYAFCYQKITSRSNSTNPLPSTQCHGHDPEEADLTVYLAITVSTYYIFIAYIYTYIYIFIFIWIIFFTNQPAFLFAIVVVCNVSKTLFKIGGIGLSV